MGYRSKSVLAIIQARTDSSRLPGKVIMDFAGMPSIQFLIRRVVRSRYVDQVVLATSDQASDDRLADFGAAAGVPVFRGSKDDVLSRFTGCMKSHKPADIVIRACGDNFLMCPSVIDRSIEKLADQNLDLVNPFLTPTYPFGSGAEACRSEVLTKLDELTRGLDPKYREHVLLYAYERKDLFKSDTLEAPKTLSRPQLKISVDTPEDFERVSRFMKAVGSAKCLEADLPEIVKFYDETGGT